MTQPSAATAYSQIRRWIVEGRFRPGEHLVEQRIAEELDLSRTPVREALRMLQSEGLVRFEANRGATVRSLTISDIADLYELRARLESMAAELAAVRATPDQLERLAVAEVGFAEAAEAAEAARDGDREATRRVFHQNDIFHLTFLEAAHHERLVQTLIRTVDPTLVFQAFRHYRPSGLERSVLFHHLVSEAIRRGEGVRAGGLIYEHVMQGRDQLLAVVGDDTSVDALYESLPDERTGGRHQGLRR